MMPLPNPRKLKRGLKDISDIFQTQDSVNEQPLRPAPARLEILSLICPDAPALSLLLNAWFAMRPELGHQQIPIFNLDHLPINSERHKYGHRYPPFQSLKYYDLTYEELFRLGKSDQVPVQFQTSSPYLFLSFNHVWENIPQRVFPLLDKCILYVRPLLRGVTEAYKLIKSAYLTNKETDYFLIFDGAPDDGRGRIIFEKLSAMVSHHMGTQIHWLGNMRFMDIMENETLEGLSLDPIFLEQGKATLCPEKVELEKTLLHRRRKEAVPNRMNLDLAETRETDNAEDALSLKSHTSPCAVVNQQELSELIDLFIEMNRVPQEADVAQKANR